MSGETGPGTDPGTIRITPALARISTGAMWLLGVIVCAADAVAFAESYHGLNLWARGHKLAGTWAAIWPAQVDAFILAGEIALLLAAVHHWPARARMLGWSMALGGLAGSITANAGHVGPRASISDHVTAAVPPIAAMAGLVVALAVIKYLAARQLTSGRLDVTEEAAPAPVDQAPPAPVPAPVRPIWRMIKWRLVSRVDAPAYPLAEARVLLAPPAVPALSAAETPELPAPAEDPQDDPHDPQDGPGAASSNEVLALIPHAVPALVELPSEAARVRYALGVLGMDAEPVPVREWLAAHGQEIKAGTVKTAIQRARRAAGMTGDAGDHEDDPTDQGPADLAEEAPAPVLRLASVGQ